MKKLLIINGSPRKNGCDAKICAAASELASKYGYESETIWAYDLDLGGCRACMACKKTQKCVQKDDAVEITEKVKNADTLVFTTPIYYYEMSGQMKTLLDRANPLFVADYRFRDVYFLASAAEDEDFVPQRAQSGLEGWIECFEKAHLTGSVFGGGVTDVGEIKGHHALAEAYEMGKAIR